MPTALAWPFVFLALTSPGAAQDSRVPASPRVDGAALLADVAALAADSMEGRRTGTAGNERARRFIERAFAAAGIEPLAGSYRLPFPLAGQAATGEGGVNIAGRIAGADTSRVIVVSAHYDHVGRRGDDIFNGADDNASGVAALLAIARDFAGSPPSHTLLIVAMDAEEMGLQGARAFVARPPVPVEAIAANINLDMVSRSDRGELWVAGTRHYPQLGPLVQRLAARAKLRLRAGHDVPGTGGDDWTGASDHGAFHAAGIPFLYFGVEDHADYHRPTDDVERIDPDFFVRAVATILDAVRSLDRELDALIPKR